MAVYNGSAQIENVYIGNNALTGDNQFTNSRENIFVGDDIALNYPLTVTLVDEIVNGSIEPSFPTLNSSEAVGDTLPIIFTITPDDGFVYDRNTLTAGWVSDDAELNSDSGFFIIPRYYLTATMIQGGIEGTLTISGTLPAE